MTYDHDPQTRTVVAWLREDARENAERPLLAALNEIDHTRQRRSWWPARRLPDMNNFVKVLVATAAVVAVGFVGINMLPASGGTGGAGSPPTVAPTATPGPTPAPLPASGPLDAGTYAMTDGRTTFHVTVPPGWDTDGTDLRKHRDASNEVTFQLYTPTIHVYPDACATDEIPPPAGPTADDLVAALQAQGSSEVSDPSQVTIGGRPGVRLAVSIPDGLDLAACTIGTVRIWSSGASGSYLAGLGPTGSAPVYIVEAPAGRLVFTTGSETKASDADLAELQSIVDSIEFIE